jgi:hypothetical protein
MIAIPKKKIQLKTILTKELLEEISTNLLKMLTTVKLTPKSRKINPI